MTICETGFSSVVELAFHLCSWYSDNREQSLVAYVNTRAPTRLYQRKKKTKQKTKCKTLLNKYALLHFSYHVLVSGDQLLPEEAQDGSIMYQNFETAWGREMCLWPGRDRAFQMCGSILWKGWNCQLGKWFIFSRGYIEMFSGISFSDNENGKNKCALVYFIWDRIKRSLQRAGHTIAWAAERGGWLNRNLMQILHLYVWSQFQEEDCQSL